jgi:hypothetical protein
MAPSAWFESSTHQAWHIDAARGRPHHHCEARSAEAIQTLFGVTASGEKKMQ